MRLLDREKMVTKFQLDIDLQKNLPCPYAKCTSPKTMILKMILPFFLPGTKRWITQWLSIFVQKIVVDHWRNPAQRP